MGNMTKEEIRVELLKILGETSVDFQAILSLSNELMKHDDSNVRFSVDAGIINRLGKELVSKGETAISELIKNAYDAEASYVHLVFKNAYNSHGVLLIEDDGLGMSRDELINGFMRLSSSDKIHNPITPNYKRVKAGKKGIGRFATQRLGNRLTIITQCIDSEYAIKTVINWSDFEVDQNLNEIASRIEYVKKERDRGTTLIIENLQDAWSDAAVKRAYKYTENLLQPEPLSKERQDWENERNDPGFKASFYREFVSSETLIIDEDIAFYNHALATIEGFIDDNGYGYWRSSSSKLEISTPEYRRIGGVRDNNDVPFKNVHNIHFKTYYFIYDTALIPKTLFSYIKNLGNELGGIKLYRNGFRVPPYGEGANDWIGFDESVRRRTYIFPHQNQSFFGFVEIDAKASDLFEETSSREGLIENEAYQELTDFVYRAVITACLEIAGLRERKQTANQKNWDRRPSEKVSEALSELAELADENSENDFEQEKEYDKQKFKRVYEKLSEGYAEEQEEKKRLVDEVNMLRIFAGLGLVIGEFIHEIKNYLPGFDAEIKYLQKLLSENPNALDRVRILDKNIKSFTSYTSYFDKAISRNVQRDTEPINVKERIHAFCETIDNNRRKAHIELSTNLEDDDVFLMDLTTVPMHPSEWASILFNLYTNAKKAIKKDASCTAGKINISCGESGSNVFVEFSDNGIGVDPLIQDKIFEAFVTTTSVASKNSDDAEIYTGTGLGLKIVRDIITSYNGKVFLKPAIDGFKTTFRIEIPKKNVI